MPTFEITKDGSTFDVDVPEGVDPNEALAQFTGRQQSLADSVAPERSIPQRIGRGLALGGRTVVGAVPKAATGIADLASSILNVIPAGASMASEALGGPSIDARLPTDSTQSLDAFLTDIVGLPEPENFGERVVAGGGDVALTGGAGSAALAPKLGGLIKAVPSLADDIGAFFANNPLKSGAVEAGGGVGAVGAGELAVDADASTGQQILAELVGGIAGSVAPTAALNTGRRAATGIANAADAVTKGEVRAAKTLQDASADPAAAAVAARDAPEGVLPARATDDPGLQAIEAKVLADDPVAAAKAADDLAGAETRSLTELADQFGPTTNKADFQQNVVQSVTPEGTTIKAGQPDAMLDDAAKAFDGAYETAKGFPVTTETVNAAGGNVPLRELLSEAVGDTDVLTTPAIQKRALERVETRLAALEAKEVTDGILSDDLLTLRSTIRKKQRQLSKAGGNNPDAAEEAELLNEMSRKITEVLDSQLPPDAAQTLRATDGRYGEFLTVQDAVLRSGEKGLTAEALRASAKARASSKGQFARGKTGELGRLAETGKDAAATLGKPDQAARLTRNMTPEQLQGAKADFNAAIAAKATPPSGRLSGEKYLAQVEKNRETLTAAGFTKAEIGNMKRIGSELKLVQGKSPAAVTELLEDNVGTVMRLFGAIAGSKAGTRALKFFGSAGTGPSLILAQFGSKQMQKTLTSLSVDKADALIRAAATNKELFAALMTRPSTSLKRQAEAARTINAWITKVGGEKDTEDK